MKKEKKQGVKSKSETPKMRQIIIETDGSKMKLVKAEVAGRLELVAILNVLLADINKQALTQK